MKTEREKAQALEAMVAGLNRTGGLRITTSATARNVVTIFEAVWGFALSQRGPEGAAWLLRMAFESMDSRIRTAGFAAEVEDRLAPIRATIDLATNPAFASAAEAASGMADVLGALRSES